MKNQENVKNDSTGTFWFCFELIIKHWEKNKNGQEERDTYKYIYMFS